MLLVSLLIIIVVGVDALSYSVVFSDAVFWLSMIKDSANASIEQSKVIVISALE
jgi:hypothetical protein